jgi:hypothetical protein
VQEELHDPRTVAVQVARKINDLAVAVEPDLLVVYPRLGQACAAQDVAVHAHDQDFLIVRPVEDANSPALSTERIGATA